MVAPERTLARDALDRRVAIAASAFTALVNAFVVSLGGLVPGTSLGGLALVMGPLALDNTAFLGRGLLQARVRGRRLVQPALFLASAAVYGARFRTVIALLGSPPPSPGWSSRRTASASPAHGSCSERAARARPAG